MPLQRRLGGRDNQVSEMDVILLVLAALLFLLTWGLVLLCERL
jgi:hypothetical protein